VTRRRLTFLGAAALALAGCGGDEGLPQGSDPVELDPDELTTEIDNRWWPMEPGTRWTYRELDEEGKELRVVVTVSSETKEIANGVVARIVRDTVTEDGELVEDTFDWYAQDDEGNLWYFGEDTTEFEDGKPVGHVGAWEAGIDGALPGVVLPADPEVGMSYRQEYYAGEAEDRASVLSVDATVSVPFGAFTGALQTKDTTPLEPDVVEHKFYVREVGPVLALKVRGDTGREELVSYTRH
jgi:hypothetical protein